GNPAAIVIMDKMQPNDWMQLVAAEMNLSETAFLAPNKDPFKRVWQLKWFTPTSEVELCGHATLATAHIMFSEGYAKPQEAIRFETLSGELSAKKDSGGWIELDFPTSQTKIIENKPAFADALGLDPVQSAKATFDEEFDYLFELKSADQVKSFIPDKDELASLGSRAVTITAKGNQELSGNPDFVSRVFAPNVGIDEDPVTGSAHCYLSHYWNTKMGQTQFTAHQISKRGGTIKVDFNDDRTSISGRAVTIFKGSLLK
ncbi:MAG: PhzF family phenazine biosynthesis protein, partial [Moorea sp. SIO4E2]|uniref:PhzF family phenazine biosynthesis protein n=1 Tax=Moorena sp. SIO4E2 TaxID=2607826 RepID=UPI0013B6C3C1